MKRQTTGCGIRTGEAVGGLWTYRLAPCFPMALSTLPVDGRINLNQQTLVYTHRRPKTRYPISVPYRFDGDVLVLEWESRYVRAKRSKASPLSNGE